jgi:hypothetical protein
LKKIRRHGEEGRKEGRKEGKKKGRKEEVRGWEVSGREEEGRKKEGKGRERRYGVLGNGGQKHKWGPKKEWRNRDSYMRTCLCMYVHVLIFAYINRYYI